MTDGNPFPHIKALLRAQRTMLVQLHDAEQDREQLNYYAGMIAGLDYATVVLDGPGAA